MLKRLCATLVLVALGAVAPANAQVVVPDVPPVTGNCFPFGCDFGGDRYQQIYSATAFSSAFSISEISFSLSSGGPLNSGTFDIYLSTTSVAVGALSDADFDSNRGADNTLFGSFVLGGAAPAILSFGGLFNYDPSMGNLLMDIQVTGLVPGNSFFDRADGGGIVSRAWGTGNSGQTSDIGLITTFNGSLVAVPEPGSLLLVAVGLIAIAARRRSTTRVR